MKVSIILFLKTFKQHILSIAYANRSVNEVSAREKLEHSVGLEVEVSINTVLAEGEASLARTGGSVGLT